MAKHAVLVNLPLRKEPIRTTPIKLLLGLSSVVCCRLLMLGVFFENADACNYIWDGDYFTS
jgi:hypothetical protein